MVRYSKCLQNALIESNLNDIDISQYLANDIVGRILTIMIALEYCDYHKQSALPHLF